jgi:hypothetical protein
MKFEYVCKTEYYIHYIFIFCSLGLHNLYSSFFARYHFLDQEEETHIRYTVTYCCF